MLQFIGTKNYKNLSLLPPVELNNLNIFIGSNGSGKSNYISCLKFLRDCLTTIPDESRGVTSFEDAVSKLGADRILDNSVKSPARVNFEYCFSQNLSPGEPCDDKFSTMLTLTLFVDRKKNKVIISREFLFGGQNLNEMDPGPSPFYYYKFHDIEIGKGAASVFDNPRQNSIIHLKPLDNIPTNSLGLTTLPKLLEYSKYSPESTPAYKRRRDLVDFISQWQFYNANNMDLNQIRTSEPKIGGSDIYLSTSGDNLALVLENLIQQDIDFEDSINQAMKSILPKTRRIRPIRSGRLSLTVEWYFEDIKEPFYLSDMSDGTVRMLCWATILHSPVLPSLLVIDEPELGLHVSWMRILAEWIKQASRKTQIIVTTHSPDLLDHFTDCLENVYCFYSEDQTHFTMKTLSKEMLSPSLEEGWELGDLYRVGDPNVGGWPW
ncbi:AAA family ATPase [Cronbergia sp. UHCC 0137]|uniref:AAA family ATPase n=1 Tax=Cronbergia sp. UHCC 0137 TaxID=3110239 RepID=UPI002B208D87|nr:AAA family ATPase [Cronbergia sp. UHCC 0137]MEA5618122.1 AAA family ATPase [Cronbergia sp. UHCC 0137]